MKNVLLCIIQMFYCLYIVSEYKRAKQEIKKSASDTMKLQKKMKKGNCAYRVFKPSVVVALFPPKYLDFYISYTMLEIRTRLDFFVIFNLYWC